MTNKRKQMNPKILELLHRHDGLPFTQFKERHELERQILFLMEEVKLCEKEHQGGQS